MNTVTKNFLNRPILKADEEKRLVYGIVLEPDFKDAQGDVITSPEIEKAAHKFIMEGREIGDRHTYQADAKVAESYIAPVDFRMGGQDVKKGTWIIAVKVYDDAIWQKIKAGEYTGFSIGATGTRA